MSYARNRRAIALFRLGCYPFAASLAPGMWMRGEVPLGYDVVARKLVVNEDEAPRVRRVLRQ